MVDKKNITKISDNKICSNFRLNIGPELQPRQFGGKYIDTSQNHIWKKKNTFEAG